MKHCPEVAELYITPRNLGFYECNGVEAVALGARVVQDTGQAGALIVSGATVSITPQWLYYVEGHALPRLYNKTAGGKAFGILPDGQKVDVLFKKEGGACGTWSICTGCSQSIPVQFHSVITVTRWPALLLWVVRVCLLRRWISGILSEALHLQTVITHWRCTRFCAA